MSIFFHHFSTEVRLEERRILESAGVVQSLTVGVAPIVVVIASVCTFTLHMALGYDLTAAEVFLPIHKHNYTLSALRVDFFKNSFLSKRGLIYKKMRTIHPKVLTADVRDSHYIITPFLEMCSGDCGSYLASYTPTLCHKWSM